MLFSVVSNQLPKKAPPHDGAFGVILFILFNESLCLNDSEDNERYKNDTANPEHPVIAEITEDIILSVAGVLLYKTRCTVGTSVYRVTALSYFCPELVTFVELCGNSRVICCQTGSEYRENDRPEYKRRRNGSVFSLPLAGISGSPLMSSFYSMPSARTPPLYWRSTNGIASLGAGSTEARRASPCLTTTLQAAHG